jgi:outer membrane protein assembly factor BamB
MSRRLPAAACVLLSAALCSASDWPGFRGPRGDGRSPETDAPTRWSPTENVAWKTPLPGEGHSSPVVAGDRVLLACCVEIPAADSPAPADPVTLRAGKHLNGKFGRRMLVCLDRRDGKVLWEKEVCRGPLDRIHRENSHASPTPVTDGKHVWIAFLDFPNVVAACYDLDGNEVWRKSPGRFFSKHGYACSPVLHGNLLILNFDQDEPGADFKDLKDVPGDAYLLALDKSDGSPVWKTDRPARTRSYCVPVIVEIAGRKQMILTGSKCVSSYDPDTGRQNWIVKGPTEQFVSSPVLADGGVLFLTYGFPKRGIMGIRPDGAGDVTKTHVLWNIEKASRGGYVPSPVAVGKYVYVVNDEGIATCADPKTGEQVWIQRIGRHFHASPVLVGDALYFADDDGKVTVIRASDKYEEIARIDMGEGVFASPAVSRGQIFLRTAKHLYCIGKPKE